MVVSKKVCKSAVGRNRIRPRVYEWVRPKISTMNDIYDIVYIVSSAELRTMPATELATILGELTKSVLAPTDKK